MFSLTRALSLGLVVLPFVSAVIHDVQVGASAQLVFGPEAIFAQPGDQVVFHFNPKNHTVTQSSFASPCGPKEGGFDSGFQPVAANSTQLQPTFTITVNDTNPIWVYCRQTGHCGKGMVFAVNCGADGSPNSFTNFKNAALAIGAAAAGSATPSPSPAPSPTTSTSGAASTPGVGNQVHKVIVGGANGNVYTPANITAQPGDVVTFEFHQKNHTVTQSTFGAPCSPFAVNGTTGFDSGFTPVSANAVDNFPTFNFTVKDTKPVWAYCRQGNHCVSGMVFAINANESSPQSFDAFMNKAKSGTSGTSGTAAATGSASSSTPSSGSNNGAGSIRIGGASATLAAVALLAFIL